MSYILCYKFKKGIEKTVPFDNASEALKWAFDLVTKERNDSFKKDRISDCYEKPLTNFAVVYHNDKIIKGFKIS